MADLRDLTIRLTHLQRQCEQAQKAAPAILGNAVANDIRQNFIRQGLMTDNGLQRWKPSEAARKEGRRTLIKSAALMNEVHFEVQGNTAYVGVNNNLIPYAARHNEGLKNMQKRQFIYVRKQVIQDALKELDQIIKA